MSVQLIVPGRFAVTQSRDNLNKVEREYYLKQLVSVYLLMGGQRRRTNMGVKAPREFPCMLYHG